MDPTEVHRINPNARTRSTDKLVILPLLYPFAGPKYSCVLLTYACGVLALDRLRTEPIPLSSPAASADAPEEPQFDSEELRSRFRQFELLILVYSALHLGAQHLMLYGNVSDLEEIPRSLISRTSVQVLKPSPPFSLSTFSLTAYFL